MDQLTYVISKAVYYFIGALQILMFIRAILSWLPIDEDSPIVTFIYNVTETVIFPVRSLLERSEQIASLPIDVSFFVTFLLLSLVQSLMMAL